MDILTLALSKNSATVTTDSITKALGYTPANQEKVSQLSLEIVDLTVTDYVKAEAEEVANKIINNRSLNSLVLLMASDLHVSPLEVTRTAIKHMGQGMNEIREYITPDAVVLLGDYVYDVSPLSKSQAVEDMKLARKYVSDATKGIPTVWVNGNHDYYQSSSAYAEYRLSDETVYALVGSHNSKEVVVDVDNVGRNYGYIDFNKQRIRLIYLNTTDINGVNFSSHSISNEQGQWLVNTGFNLKDKEDEESWGIIVCTHIPAFSNATLTSALSCFVDRSSFSGFNTTYTFADTKAQLICTFHGHIHNFKVTDMLTTAGNKIRAICIPNALPSRENPYTTTEYQEVDSDGNAVSYPKTAGTSKDTSFNAVIVDRDNSKVHAICYGAGYDREISYGESEEITIVNQIPLSTDSTGAIYNGVGYKDGTRIGSDGTDRTGASTDATGFIPCTIAYTLYFANCQILADGSNTSYQSIVCYDSSKTYLGTRSVSVPAQMDGKDYDLDNNNYLTRYNCADLWANTAFVRITGNYIGADSIITVNQPIE